MEGGGRFCHAANLKCFKPEGNEVTPAILQCTQQAQDRRNGERKASVRFNSVQQQAASPSWHQSVADEG